MSCAQGTSDNQSIHKLTTFVEQGTLKYQHYCASEVHFRISNVFSKGKGIRVLRGDPRISDVYRTYLFSYGSSAFKELFRLLTTRRRSPRDLPSDLNFIRCTFLQYALSCNSSSSLDHKSYRKHIYQLIPYNNFCSNFKHQSCK
jgi:hypothetical protein